MKTKPLFFLMIGFVLTTLSACGTSGDISPGRYSTVHQGQTWVLDLSPGGSWTGTFSGELLTVGTYTIDGDRITWQTDSHCEETGNPGAATYRVRERDGRYTFSLKGRDPCQSRQIILEDEIYQIEN
jgi:hypothetical protein